MKLSTCSIRLLQLAAIGCALGLVPRTQAGDPHRCQLPRPEFAKLAAAAALPKYDEHFPNARWKPTVELGVPKGPQINLTQLPKPPQIRFGEPTAEQLAMLAKEEGRYPWRTNIVTTIFWVGEPAAQNNPVSNVASSWDPDWQGSYGGFDDPAPSGRSKWLPAAFVPKQNPFYCALPYNDVQDRHVTKAEAAAVVPWFKEDFRKPGVSVCRNRWIAIRKGNRVCYAQWSDCGPFRTDHWQYVFGTERPKPNLNRGAGLDVSPAVRDFLRLVDGHDVTDWRFVEFEEVPVGPWSKLGSNNDFVKAEAAQKDRRLASTRP